MNYWSGSINGSTADATKSEFVEFINVQCLTIKNIAWMYSKIMCSECIYVFVLSHGQADVERGFNINKDSVVENLQQLSLKVLRCMYHALIAMDAKPHNFHITNAVVVECKQACSQYIAELEENEEKTVTSQELKQKHLQEGI